jgi:hypothetical protein
MSKILRIAATGVAMGSLAIASTANAATSAQATAEAEILTSLSVDVDPLDSVLDFGQIAPGSSAVSVVIDPATDNYQGGACPSGIVCPGNGNAPTFNVSGYQNSLVDISFTNATETLTGPSATMTVGSFTTNAAGNQVTLDGSGDASFSVGGSLGVGASQAAGTYTGTLEVNVAYN